MENKLVLQYALQCIEELANEPLQRLSPLDVSRRRGIPMDVCRDVLRRLEDAGILSADEQQCFGLLHPIEDLTALEILRAVMTKRVQAPAFKMLYQQTARTLRKTLRAVWMAQDLGVFPGELA